MTTQHAKSNAREGDGVAERDNAISNSGNPHMRLLVGMKYGPTVHGEACKDPAFKARHDAAIDAALAAMQAQQGEEPVAWEVYDGTYRVTRDKDEADEAYENGCAVYPLARISGAPR
jgi:hypothetical protein